MSSRRTSSRRPTSSGITHAQVAALVGRMEQLVPEIAPTSNKVPATKVLEETCSYVRSLQREVGDLSERLSELLTAADVGSEEAAVIRALLTRN